MYDIRKDHRYTSIPIIQKRQSTGIVFKTEIVHCDIIPGGATWVHLGRDV